MRIIATFRILTLCLVGLNLISCASISSQEQSRISVDLQGDCQRLYGSNKKDPVFGWDYVGWTGRNRVFAIGNANGQQSCGFAHDGILGKSHNELTIDALGFCNSRMPGGIGCQVYAIDSNIVFSPYATQANSMPMSQPINNSNPPPASSNAISIQDAKSKCSDLGFKSGTEGFGKCVLQLSK